MEKLKKENAMLTEAMDVLHAQVDEYESEIRAMKGGKRGEKSPMRRGQSNVSSADSDSAAIARVAEATRPVLRAAIMEARAWRSRATRAMTAELKPLGGARRRGPVAQPQSVDVLELRRAGGEGGKDVREQLIKACCDARVAKANCKVIQLGEGKDPTELLREAERKTREAEERVSKAVEECKWALIKHHVPTTSREERKKEDVLRARVKIKKQGFNKRRTAVLGEKDLERLLVKLMQ